MNTHQIQIGAQVFDFKVTIERDDGHGTPWENEDGHGPVSEWHPGARAKCAGELILDKGRNGTYRAYNFSEACKIALRDGWDHTASKIEGEPETKRQQAARAARADFEYLRAWCNDEWQYEFIEVVLLDQDGEETEHRDSIGGTDSYYAPEQARLMCEELARQVDASGPTSDELNLDQGSAGRLDYLHTELRAIHESETDDDSIFGFDAWVSAQASNPNAQDQATAMEYLKLSAAEAITQGEQTTALVSGFLAAPAPACNPGDSTRAATQEFAIFDALVKHCGRPLTADFIDMLKAEIVEEMRSGSTAWAFAPSAQGTPDELRAVNSDHLKLEQDASLIARLFEASQDDNAKLKAALAAAVGTLESVLLTFDSIDAKRHHAARMHALALVKGLRLDNPPPLRWDGCHGFSIATTGQRFATIANSFKGSGEQAQEGTDLVHALARLGAVALTY